MAKVTFSICAILLLAAITSSAYARVLVKGPQMVAVDECVNFMDPPGIPQP